MLVDVYAFSASSLLCCELFQIYFGWFITVTCLFGGVTCFACWIDCLIIDNSRYLWFFGLFVDVLLV